MGLSHSVSRLMPVRLRNKIQPYWHTFQVYRRLVKERNGSVRRDKKQKCWIVTVPLAGRNMEVCVRGIKEFFRLVRFYDKGFRDVALKFIFWLDDHSVVYDIGSANGLEGFHIAHLHGGRVVFVEPFTTSIQSILMTIAQSANTTASFDVVHAGCGDQETYDKVYMDSLLPGSTKNTFSDRKKYDESLGRDRSQYLASQWIKGVTIDGLHSQHGLPEPDYVKIDVDGMETYVMKGALETLQSRRVKAWCIEVTGEDRIKFVKQLMEENGYILADEFEHYPGLTPRTLDYIFVKSEALLESWRNFRGEVK